MRAETRIPFAALATVPFVMVLSNSMIVPVLPNIQAALHKSLFQVGLLITAFSLTAGLIIPLGGYLSDRYGRKVVIVPCLVIFGLGGLLCGFAPLWRAHAFLVLLVGRVIQGLGAGGTYQVAMALAGDIFRSVERSKVLGLLEASNGLGKVASPIMGAAAMALAWFAPFYIYPVIAWTSAGLVWRLVEEPGPGSASHGQFLHGLRRLWSEKGWSLGACFAAGALALFFLFGILSYYSDVLEKTYRVQGVTRGLVIAIPVAIMALTSYLAGTLLVRYLSKLSKALVLFGLGIVAAAFVAMFFLSRQVVPFTAAISAMGLGNGLLLPSLNTMITSAAGRAERGTLTALYGTVRFFGAALGPPAFDRAVKAGTVPAYLGAAGLALLVLLAAAAGIRQGQMLAHLVRSGTSAAQPKGARPGRRSASRLRPGDRNRLT